MFRWSRFRAILGQVGKLVTIAVLTGCYAPSAQTNVPCSAAGECPSGQVCGPDNRCVVTIADAGPMDPDTGPIDASPDACADCPQLVARYRFENSLGDDTSGHAASAVGGSISFVMGQSGQALHIPEAGTTHLRIEDTPAWDIAAGKIELHFRYDAGAPAGDLGLISRDALNSNTDGHFSIRLSHDRKIVVRIQRMSMPTVQAYRCTGTAVAPGTWHHVELAFGTSGLALVVDGTLANGTSWTGTDMTVHDCTTAWDRGIAGNDTPIVIGALTVISVEGTGAPVSGIAAGLDIDDVAIWSATR